MPMSLEEFMFALPEKPERIYPLTSLDDYDQIIGDAIRCWEENVRCGVVILYQIEHNGNLRKSQTATPRQSIRKIPLGEFPVEDLRRKLL